MKSAKEYWKETFDEYPQNDAEKLAVTMMAQYYHYTQQLKDKPVTELNERNSVDEGEKRFFEMCIDCSLRQVDNCKEKGCFEERTKNLF